MDWECGSVPKMLTLHTESRIWFSSKGLNESYGSYIPIISGLRDRCRMVRSSKSSSAMWSQTRLHEILFKKNEMWSMEGESVSTRGSSDLGYPIPWIYVHTTNINILIRLHTYMCAYVHAKTYILYMHVTRIIKEDIVNLEGGTGRNWRERWIDIDGWRCRTHMKF